VKEARAEQGLGFLKPHQEALCSFWYPNAIDSFVANSQWKAEFRFLCISQIMIL